jgi:hypothetical protein
MILLDVGKLRELKLSQTVKFDEIDLVDRSQRHQVYLQHLLPILENLELFLVG